MGSQQNCQWEAGWDSEHSLICISEGHKFAFKLQYRSALWNCSISDFLFKPYNWDLSLNLEIGCAGANLFHFLIKKKNLYCLLPIFLPIPSLSSPWWEAIPQCVGVSGQTVPTALPHTPVSFHYDYPKCKDHLRFTPCLWPFSDGFPLDHSLDPV